MLKSSVRWVEGKQFVAEGGSGHAIVLDTPPGIGGRNTGVTPMELMLMGTAGCTAVDVVYILGDRMHQDVRRLSVSAEADRAEEEPKVFTEVRLRYEMAGRDVKAKQVERALKLSLEKYCSASAMIEHTAKVVAQWSFHDEASDETHTGELSIGPLK